MERPAHLALRALPVARIGVVERVWIQRHHGIEPGLVLRNAIEILLHDGARRDAAGAHRRLHVGNRGFHDGKRRLLCRHRLLHSEKRDEK